MKRLLVLGIGVALASMAQAEVWTTVYRCDEMTPLDPVDPNDPTVYQDIMVGTRLVIVVSSDAGGYWFGSLQLSWDDANDATLTGRGYDPNRSNYADSSLEAAGGRASVRPSEGFWGVGLDLEAASSPLTPPDPTPGDWFIVDYRAERVGACDVGLYDLDRSLEIPLSILSFSHVPSRDFDADAVVNFEDFALFASRWRSDSGLDPNSADAPMDLDCDRRIDIGDLALFSEYWLAVTDCNEVGADPNAIPPPDAER